MLLVEGRVWRTNAIAAGTANGVEARARYSPFMSQVFLLSPARCDGRRAALVMNPAAAFPLAVRLRDAEGAPIGEVFSFLSGLYFRGKIAYATRFADPPRGTAASFVITTDRGLVEPEVAVTRDDLVAFSRVDIGAGDDRYRAPLARAAERLAATIGAATRVVLLGSIATGKYADVLLDVFGERLVFPGDFVGRGDMSRGGLMLRCASDGRELEYLSVAGAVRRG
jgi:hypothetical protein